MRDRELYHLTIAEAARLIEARSLSPVELTQTYLERIERLDANLGAYITVMADSALAQASRAESEIISGGYRGRMHGIPIAVKDIIYTRGVLTSAGSRVLADHVPDYDSTIVERLDAEGSVLLGKLNLSEFAVGGTIDHPYGTPRNPWDTGKSAGGSSSGSAVAVAGGLCAGSLGSDTGGSIRGPSAFCGIVGLRPTYGRVTRYGVIPMSWSLDTVGPMTHTVEDCAIMLQAVAGHDERDSSSSREPVPDYSGSFGEWPRGARVALPREAMDFDGLNGEVKSAVTAAADQLAEIGADVDHADLPMLAHSGAVFLATADVDAAAYHMPMAEVPCRPLRLEHSHQTAVRGHHPFTDISERVARKNPDQRGDVAHPGRSRLHSNASQSDARPSDSPLYRLARRILSGETRPCSATLYQPRCPCRSARHFRAVRIHGFRDADWPSDNRPPILRTRALPGSASLRTGSRLAIQSPLSLNELTRVGKSPFPLMGEG